MKIKSGRWKFARFVEHNQLLQILPIISFKWFKLLVFESTKKLSDINRMNACSRYNQYGMCRSKSSLQFFNSH